MRRWFIRGFIGLVLAGGAILATASLLDTTERPPSFPAPGYHVADLAVPGRDGPVRLHIWYPTDSDTPTVLVGQNGLFYGEHVRPDAPPLAGALPVVVVSHGSGGNAERLGWLAGYLASQGMIVVAPNHPGTTSGDSDPFRTPLVWERIDDLKAALDLLETSPPAGLTPDMSRVASVGFSLGGHTALGIGGVQVRRDAFIAHCAAKPQAADCVWMVAAGVDFAQVDAARYDADHRDPRVKATVAIDPALVAAVNREALAGLDHPFLVINLGDPATLPEGMDASPLATAVPGAEYMAIAGAAHFSFLAECSTLGVIVIGLAGEDNICSDRGLRDRGVIHDELRQGIAGFLNGSLGVRTGDG
jgi:predicted dienelactone hydrolase